MSDKQYNIGYDFDGVVNGGDITPKPDGVIITGRSELEAEQVNEKLTELGLKLPVYFFDAPVKSDFLIAKHKAELIKQLGVKTFYEDSPEQVKLIEKLAPDVKVILVEPPKRQFIIVTKDFSGLGLAKILQDEGQDVLVGYENDELKPDEKEPFSLVGDGLIEKMPLQQVLEIKDDYDDAYWVFDHNNLSEVSEELRADGFKVLGASNLTYQMEHDRQFGIDLAMNCGLETPPSDEFNDIQKAIKFLQDNEDDAYVFKPDDDDRSYMTYVPNSEKDHSANEELQNYLQSLTEQPRSFILQKRIKGVELNVEVWFSKGRPVFAWCCLESKKKLNGDKGENTGCGHDISFIVPLYCQLVTNSVGKMFEFYQEQEYTGFGDANIIIADNKFYFLEFCNRFGYNAHPNLFMNLAVEPISKILAQLIDGDIDHMRQNFKKGFGASVSLYLDHKRENLPLYVSDDVDHKFFTYDEYHKDDKRLLAGYATEVGVVGGFGYTIKDASCEALNNAEKINYPDRAHRTDIGNCDYPSSPMKRYEALEAMNLLI